MSRFDQRRPAVDHRLPVPLRTTRLHLSGHQAAARALECSLPRLGTPHPPVVSRVQTDLLERITSHTQVPTPWFAWVSFTCAALKMI